LKKRMSKERKADKRTSSRVCRNEFFHSASLEFRQVMKYFLFHKFNTLIYVFFCYKAKRERKNNEKKEKTTERERERYSLK